MIREKKSPKKIENIPGVVTKYPSGLCHLAPVIEGPKVFLYRNLGEHLIKLRADVDTFYIDYYFDYFQLYCHPELKNMVFNSCLEKNIFLWAHRILWAKESDALFIKSGDFLLDPDPVFKTICTLFDVNHSEKITFPSFNVKTAGYLGQNAALNEIIPQPAPTVRSKQGIIPTAVIENSNMVNTAREWVRSNTSIDESFL
jgi:hypothetical protein